jgi:hypothetical protein
MAKTIILVLVIASSLVFGVLLGDYLYNEIRDKAPEQTMVTELTGPACYLELTSIALKIDTDEQVKNSEWMEENKKECPETIYNDVKIVIDEVEYIFTFENFIDLIENKY